MSTEESNILLDADRIRELVGRLGKEEIELFTSVIREVRNHGTAISDAVVSSLSRKFADKARQLAGDGESS